MDTALFVVAILFGSYAIVFGLAKRVHEWFVLRHIGGNTKLLPPGDMGWPFIGNFLSILKAFISQKPYSFVNDMVKRYGKTGIYKFSIFWSPCVIVCSPETCRAVLMDDEKFGMSYPEANLKLIGEKSLNRPTIAEHKRMRKLITSPLNGHEALSSYIGSVEKDVMGALNEWSSGDKPIEFFTEAKNITFKIMAHIFLGPTSDSVIAAVDKATHDLGVGVGLLLPLPIDLPGFPYYKALKARKMLIKIMQDAIDDVRKSNGRSHGEKGVIDFMMKVEDEEGNKLEDEEMVDSLIMFIMGGKDSISLALMWVTLFLHQHPEILQIAKEEQKEIINKRPASQMGLTLREIRQMKYLSKVIDEALRINLFFPMFRRTKIDTNINGYLIPKGWKVLIGNGAVHLNPQTYSNPMDFVPARWDSYREKAGSFIPFGAGSHICPGADLTKFEISIFIHYFILNYKIEQLNPHGPWTYIPAPKPKDNCIARITKLSD